MMVQDVFYAPGEDFASGVYLSCSERSADLGAIATVHGRHGFFLGEQPGFEFNFALTGLLPVLIAGPGRIALARMLPLRRATREPIAALE
jgi:hypothetical protein